jgi:hypothetical protein
MNRKLKTFIGHATAGVAALAMVAGATAASAQSYRHGGGYYGGRGHHHGDNDVGVAIAGGIVGLALGAAIAGNNNHGPRYNSGYGYGYAPPPPPPRYYGGYGYGRPYAYGYGHGRDCWTTREYDRYRGTVYERTVCR